MRLLITMLLAGTLAAANAQQTGQNVSPEANGTFTLTVKTQLVVETVVVKDKKGNPINGLTAKDFTLTEDGVQQTIRFCEHQELPASPDAVPVTPKGNEDIQIYRQLGRNQIANET